MEITGKQELIATPAATMFQQEAPLQSEKTQKEDQAKADYTVRELPNEPGKGKVMDFLA